MPSHLLVGQIWIRVGGRSGGEEEMAIRELRGRQGVGVTVGMSKKSGGGRGRNVSGASTDGSYGP